MVSTILDDRQFGDTHKVAELFSISRAELYRLAGRGLVRAKKLGRKTLWDLRSIADFIGTLPDAELKNYDAPPCPAPLPAPAKATAKRGTRLPEDWKPSHDDVHMAVQRGLNVHETLAAFRDYWAAQSGQRGVKLDWAATFRNWCRREKPSAKPQFRNGFAQLLADDAGGHDAR
ncbi:MAG TPA: hypothetical protein VMJ64_00370 [Anaerolineales bacterium]|nr:hypothetical protein [Anaerolineales bacterium]